LSFSVDRRLPSRYQTTPALSFLYILTSLISGTA
jgi:hypothetical protein